MEITHLWSTPIHRGTFDPTELLTWALTEGDIANRDLETRHHIFEEDVPALQNFKELAVGHIGEYLKAAFNLSYDDFSDIHVSSWIGGTREDYQQAPHNHPNTQVTAVYYLMAEDGDLILMDPRSGANRGYPEVFKNHFYHKKLTPVSGNFIIFPSYVWHAVQAAESTRLRMVVEMRLTAPEYWSDSDFNPDDHRGK